MASMPVAQYAATRVTGIGKRFSERVGDEGAGVALEAVEHGLLAAEPGGLELAGFDPGVGHGQVDASKIMSERLWWKVSPDLMVPVPMMATLPPSPPMDSSLK
jgi:hypothetical protein